MGSGPNVCASLYLAKNKALPESKTRYRIDAAISAIESRLSKGKFKLKCYDPRQ